MMISPEVASTSSVFTGITAATCNPAPDEPVEAEPEKPDSIVDDGIADDYFDSTLEISAMDQSDSDISYELLGPVSNATLEQLRVDFNVLRTTFPVRCKHAVCVHKRGQLFEMWQNNLTIRGVVLRRMQCLNCHDK